MLDTDHPAARSVPLIAYRNFPFALAVVPCSSPWTASADAVRILAPRIRTASCSKGFTMNHYPIAVATARANASGFSASTYPALPISSTRFRLSARSPPAAAATLDR